MTKLPVLSSMFAPRRKRSHHAKPRSEGSPLLVGLIADARCQEVPVLSRGPGVGDATPHSPGGDNSICVGGCSVGDMAATVTWHSGRIYARVGAVKWLGGRCLLRQTGRHFVELRSMQNDPGVRIVFQEAQGSCERVFLTQSRRCATLIVSDKDVYELDSRAATVSHCTSTLFEWSGGQRFHRG